MARLKLFMDFLSQSSRSVYIILKQSGTVFERIPIAIQKGEHLSKEFKKLNPLQKVPCIVDGSFKLGESVAILRYLAATNRVSTILYPSDIKERARIDQFLEWQHIIRQNNYFYLDWMVPFLTGKKTPDAQLDKAKKEMERVLDIVENIWLSESKSIAGNLVSVADIFGVSEIQQTKLTNYDVRVRYPKIIDWIENVRKVTNPDFDRAHNFIYTNTKFT